MVAGTLVGGDPEYILVDAKGKPALSLDKVGGTKAAPFPVVYGALQEDNVLAEINIDPASTEEDFTRNIISVTSQLKSIVSAHGLCISELSSVVYDLDTLGDDPRAYSFGCDPEWDAYGGSAFPVPEFIGLTRVAGGHVHIGISDPSPGRQRQLVCLCDIFLGLPSVLVDKDSVRRQYYGKAGAFRPKAYGVEYRALSNFWVHKEHLIRWVYRQVNKAVSFLNTGNIFDLEEQMRFLDALIPVINSYDKGGSVKLINRLNKHPSIDIEIPEA